MHEEFEDTQWVIRICISKKDRQHNDQMKKDKQRYAIMEDATQKGKQFLLDYWHPSC